MSPAHELEICAGPPSGENQARPISNGPADGQPNVHAAEATSTPFT